MEKVKERLRRISTLPGFEDFIEYDVTDCGRVISYKSTPHIERRLRTTKRGYKQLMLHARGKFAVVEVHRLVALAFVPGYFEGAEVRHLDGDPGNNSFDNLAWGTHSENERDKIEHGRNNNLNKESCPYGHPYSPENTKSYPGKPRERNCLACYRTRNVTSKYPHLRKHHQEISDMCYDLDLTVSELKDAGAFRGCEFESDLPRFRRRSKK